MGCEVPVIVRHSLSIPFWISIKQDTSVVRATYLRLRACRGRPLIVLACPVWYPGLLGNGT